MASMIQRVTASMERGISAAATRSTLPRATTTGPDSHTMRITGGIFLRALKRSFQVLRNVRTDALEAIATTTKVVFQAGPAAEGRGFNPGRKADPSAPFA